MRWQGRRVSANVDDRRGQRPRMGRGAGIGCGGLLLVMLFAALTGTDPRDLLQLVGGLQAGTESGSGAGLPNEPPSGPPADELGQFASTVLADTEDTWHELLQRMGNRYREPTLVLFSEAVSSACGFNSAAVGPFYCPADQKVYVDLSFFADLEHRFGAGGDFAQAYVISHEVGHHVQNLLGISDEVQRARQQSSQEQANALSVRLELQADCLAGVWGHFAYQRDLIEPGDFEEALGTAAAIGDDRIQRRATGRTVPESWTHGSSEQRVQWLRRGLESGDPAACDTFDRRRP